MNNFDKINERLEQPDANNDRMPKMRPDLQDKLDRVVRGDRLPEANRTAEKNDAPNSTFMDKLNKLFAGTPPIIKPDDSKDDQPFRRSDTDGGDSLPKENPPLPEIPNGKDGGRSGPVFQEANQDKQNPKSEDVEAGKQELEEAKKEMDDSRILYADASDGKQDAGDSNENVENQKSVEDSIKEKISTPEGIAELIKNNPELAEKWEKAKEAIEVLNNPDASPAEKREACRYLGQFKGALLEAATKEALSEAGLDVESNQRTTEGDNGKTRPDIVAKNNTDKPITVFGVTVNPGETISVECKCGERNYISSELNSHIPNQLSGQEGNRVLLTSSDVDTEKATEVCDKYDATLAVIDIRTAEITDVLIEEAKKG